MRKEDKKLVEEALKKIQGDINAFHESEGMDANLLFYAAENDNEPALEELLKVESLDVTKVNDRGKNVLHVLGQAEKDQVELAKICMNKLEGDSLKKFVNNSTKTGEPQHIYILSLN